VISLFSPAKLNLFFRVIGKRDDSFHEIASLYQTISLGDFMTFQKSSKDTLTISNPHIPTDERNLIVKARMLFRKETSLHFPISIDVKKEIPIEAGLGGGSSNAATTLWALNELSNRPLALSQLASIGAHIGSDVSFFFSSGTAYCTSRGEVFENVTLPFTFEAYLNKPNFGLSTPAVYKNLDYALCNLQGPRETLASFLEGAPDYSNDLEHSALSLEPKLLKVKKELTSHFEKVILTGSGTSYFCLQPKSKNPPGTFISAISRSSSWYI